MQKCILSFFDFIFQETFTNRRSTYAILNYHGVDENEIPIIRQRACSPIVPCKAVNQVFG